MLIQRSGVDRENVGIDSIDGRRSEVGWFVVWCCIRVHGDFDNTSVGGCLLWHELRS